MKRSVNLNVFILLVLCLTVNTVINQPNDDIELNSPELPPGHSYDTNPELLLDPNVNLLRNAWFLEKMNGHVTIFKGFLKANRLFSNVIYSYTINVVTKHMKNWLRSDEMKNPDDLGEFMEWMQIKSSPEGRVPNDVTFGRIARATVRVINPNELHKPPVTLQNKFQREKFFPPVLARSAMKGGRKSLRVPTLETLAMRRLEETKKAEQEIKAHKFQFSRGHMEGLKRLWGNPEKLAKIVKEAEALPDDPDDIDLNKQFAVMSLDEQVPQPRVPTAGQSADDWMARAKKENDEVPEHVLDFMDLDNERQKSKEKGKMPLGAKDPNQPRTDDVEMTGDQMEKWLTGQALGKGGGIPADTSSADDDQLQGACAVIKDQKLEGLYCEEVGDQPGGGKCQRAGVPMRIRFVDEHQGTRIARENEHTVHIYDLDGSEEQMKYYVWKKIRLRSKVPIQWANLMGEQEPERAWLIKYFYDLMVKEINAGSWQPSEALRIEPVDEEDKKTKRAEMFHEYLQKQGYYVEKAAQVAFPKETDKMPKILEKQDESAAIAQEDYGRKLAASLWQQEERPIGVHLQTFMNMNPDSIGTVVLNAVEIMREDGRVTPMDTYEQRMRASAELFLRMDYYAAKLRTRIPQFNEHMENVATALWMDRQLIVLDWGDVHIEKLFQMYGSINTDFQEETLRSIDSCWEEKIRTGIMDDDMSKYPDMVPYMLRFHLRENDGFRQFVKSQFEKVNGKVEDLEYYDYLWPPQGLEDVNLAPVKSGKFSSEAEISDHVQTRLIPRIYSINRYLYDMIDKMEGRPILEQVLEHSQGTYVQVQNWIKEITRNAIYHWRKNYADLSFGEYISFAPQMLMRSEGVYDTRPLSTNQNLQSQVTTHIIAEVLANRPDDEIDKVGLDLRSQLSEDRSLLREWSRNYNVGQKDTSSLNNLEVTTDVEMKDVSM